jgi:putative tryptophan/tyrosine transport system substrate-binding protein
MKRREVIAAGLAFAATNWPLTLPAQQASRLKRVGVLHPGPHAVLNTHGWRAFEHGLREEGFLEGRDFEFEHRFAEDLGHLSSMAAELVEANVAVILVRGPVPMQAAKVATATIPIVMAASSTDPVGEGLIASFARPGGNITGITYAVSAERFAKQLELLKESVGPISRVAVLWDLDAELYRRTWAPTLERAASQLGLRILGPFEVRHVGDLDDAFTRMKEARAEAVFASAASVIAPNAKLIGELGIRHRLPIISAFKEFPQAGTLISYGPNIAAIYQRAAVFVGKILAGSKPSDLPVENPTTYDLVINLKTANALGLTIPLSLEAQADEVIE